MNIRFRMTATIAAMLMVGAVALIGCGAKNGAATNAGEAASTSSAGGAEAIYKQKCISCHGDQLQGRIGPSTNLTQVGGKLSRDQIVTQITNGGGGMPGFKGTLKEAEIDSLADWLSARK